VSTPAHAPLPRAETPADVLIVEDHPLAADAMRLLFEAVGHRPRIAASVAAAVRECAERRPQLMLLDLTLPDGDGFDVLAQTAAAGTSPRVVVALTGHDDSTLTARCRDAGCADVLLKPVMPRDLLARVAAWV
jgi:DNA-binding response OmpR family regulator